MKTTNGIRKHRRLIAYHEAGHAVVRTLCGYKVTEVGVHDQLVCGGAAGYSKWERALSGDSEVDIMGNLAGVVAECILAKQKFSLQRMVVTPVSASDDLEKAVERSRDCHGYGADEYGAVLEAHLSYLAARVRYEYLEPDWSTVCKVASALMDRGVLSGEDMRAMFPQSSES